MRCVADIGGRITLRVVELFDVGIVEGGLSGGRLEQHRHGGFWEPLRVEPARRGCLSAGAGA
jgi:hypothetical protein